MYRRGGQYRITVSVPITQPAVHLLLSTGKDFKLLLVLQTWYFCNYFCFAQFFFFFGKDIIWQPNNSDAEEMWSLRFLSC